MKSDGFDCDICAAPTTRYLPFRGILSEDPLEVEAFAGKWIWRCDVCNHSSCQPKPDSLLLDRYYEQSFWDSKDQGWLSRLKTMIKGHLRLRGRPQEPRATAQFECLKPFIEQLGKDWIDGVSTLEIGAGNAAFTRLIHGISKHPTSHVVEPGEQFASVYRAQNINRVARKFEELSKRQVYDILHCSHWLEHMGDVRAVFEKLAKLLADDGFLFIEVPNCGDPYWAHRYYPDPPHLQFFTPQSLARLAAVSGFVILYLGTGGQPLKSSSEAGYLHADSSELITSRERDDLLRERNEKLREKGQSLSQEGNFRAEDNHEHIRIVLRKHDPTQTSSAAPSG